MRLLNRFFHSRIDGTSAYRLGAGARCICAAVKSVFCTVVGFVVMSDAWGSDTHLADALDRIEQTLVRPEDSYGFMVTDRITIDANGKTKELYEAYGFYTATNGDVRYSIERFPNAEYTGSTSSHVLVSRQTRNDTRAADRLGKKHILRLNEKQGVISIGQADTYIYSPLAAERQRRPDKVPFQLLANPCFAPLKITPAELRQLGGLVIRGTGDQRGYEFKRERHGIVCYLRLFLDANNGDAVAMTDEWSSPKPVSTPELASDRTLRAVTRWQELPTGELVPAEFMMRQEHDGRPVLSLVRQISSPVVGDVDGAMFDANSLPEFNQPWDRVIDASEARRGVTIVARARSERKLGRAVLVAHAIVFTIVGVWFIMRRRRRRLVGG